MSWNVIFSPPHLCERMAYLAMSLPVNSSTLKMVVLSKRTVKALSFNPRHVNNHCLHLSSKILEARRPYDVPLWKQEKSVPKLCIEWRKDIRRRADVLFQGSRSRLSRNMSVEA
jgi:hypothetical protein